MCGWLVPVALAGRGHGRRCTANLNHQTFHKVNEYSQENVPLGILASKIDSLANAEK